MDIDITLPQQAYAVFESLNYTPWNALGEFLDNSIQSYINYKQRLKKLENDYKLRIDINLGYNKLEILDNASGIDKDSLRKGLKPATKPEFSDGLSEFGMGMKTAAFWMCRKWKIISKHFDSKEEFTVEFDNVEIYSKDVKRIVAYPKTVENSTHYTKLVLQDLVIDWSEDIIEDLKENIASMYRHYIRNNELDIYFNGEKLNFKVYGILRAKKAYGDNKDRELDWKKKIDFTMESGKRVTGEAGLLEVGNPTRAGFTYMRRNRVIEGLVQGVKIIDILGTANTKRSQRVFAELNLDAFRVSHTKDRILFGKELYEFWSKLRRSLEEGEVNLLKQAEEASYKTDKILKKSEENDPKIVPDKTPPQVSGKAPTNDKNSVVNNVLEINITDFDSPTVEVTGTLNKVANEMKQSYESMYKIENVLRLLIKNIETKNKISFLNENNYADVDEKNQIKNVNDFIKRVKKEESEKGYVSIRGKHDLYYTNFNALKIIIDLNHEKYFSTFFPVEKHVIDELDRLYTYRNNIAHHSYLSDEERSHIEISLQFFLKQLNGKIRLN